MIMDNELIFSEDLSCAIAVGSVYGAYALDMGAAAPDIGAGKVLYAIFNVNTVFASAGAATVTFKVVDEADTTIDSGSVVIAQTGAFAYTALTAGKIIVLPIPIGIMTQRYLGIAVTVAGATTTTGIIDAQLAFDAPSNVPIT